MNDATFTCIGCARVLPLAERYGGETARRPTDQVCNRCIDEAFAEFG